MTAGTLRPADLALHARLGIGAEWLTGVRRVTDAEARELLSSRHPGDLAGLAYLYLDPQTGRQVTVRVRRDHPEIEHGQPKDKYLASYGDNRHLYFPPGTSALLADATVPVVIIEAEKAALAVMAAAMRAGRRVLPIACGGCWGWRGRIGKATDETGARVDENGPLPDFNRVTWTRRDAIIVFDANVATNGKVAAARGALAAELSPRGALVRFGELPADSPAINGPDDLIAVYGDAALWAVLDGAAADNHRSADQGEAGARRSQATILVDLALGEDVELWHAPTGDPHITISVGEHREHHPLASRAIRDWLSRLHHTKIERTPGSQAIADALGTLGGMARYDGAEHAVHVRIAGRHTAVYLDLGDPTWRAVEITAAGWRLVTDPPVRFRRGRALLALPEPMPGGSLDAVRELIPVSSDDDWRLLAAWLVGTLRVSGPYPLLALDGEQGSGKSTTARMLRRAIDPSGAELRAEPREIRDLMIAASGGWIVALDNVSHLPPWLSDALCRISTGGALSTRQLYTDGDEHIVEAIRPTVITGITSVITRGDLQDRAIPITLPTIPDHQRRPEADLWAAYDRIRPSVLGALLDAVSLALRRESTIRLATLPRMADWARWVTAAEPSLGIRDGAILQAYIGIRDGAIEQALDGDPLAVAIRALTRPCEGTAAELLTKLTKDGRVPRGWPESPRGMSSALRRLAPQLRRIGLEVSTYREAGTGGRRLITIEGAQPSPPSQPSQQPDSFGDSCDNRGDGCDAPQSQPSHPQTSKSDGCDGGDGSDGCAPNSLQEVPANGDGYQF